MPLSALPKRWRTHGAIRAGVAGGSFWGRHFNLVQNGGGLHTETLVLVGANARVQTSGNHTKVVLVAAQSCEMQNMRGMVPCQVRSGYFMCDTPPVLVRVLQSYPVHPSAQVQVSGATQLPSLKQA